MDIVSWSFANRGYSQSKAVCVTIQPSPLDITPNTLQLYIDASDPTRSLSASVIRTQVRKLIGGLKQYGLKKNDSVCVVSFNDVSCNFPPRVVFLLTCFSDSLHQPLPRDHWVRRLLHRCKSRLHGSRAHPPPSNNSGQIPSYVT